jgi:hypothetical protein
MEDPLNPASVPAPTVAHESEGEQSVEAETDFEPIPSELQDQEASLKAFEVLTYPADYTLEVLVDKWRKRQIVIPKFQRRFVWSQVQASKLVESFLLGLPVPAIFLFSDPSTSELLVVDGQQRLKTIAYFFEGYFGVEEGGVRAVFRLTGLDDHSPYLGRTYDDLRSSNPGAFAKLNDSVLRAFVIKQLDPADDTSIYHIFERLNTGGTLLNPQEIRNCIHHGPFNDELVGLNQLSAWRGVFGRPQPDKRQRDVELILRFFALHYSAQTYKKPMKDFLNRFMRDQRHADQRQLDDFSRLFRGTSDAVRQSLGAKPFHIYSGLNAAVFDSVFVAVSRHLEALPGVEQLAERYGRLKRDSAYLSWVASSTTDDDVVSKRLARADEILFG